MSTSPVRRVLFASLCLNVLLIGLTVGNVVTLHTAPPPPPPPPSYRQAWNEEMAKFTATLPKERAEQFYALFDEARAKSDKDKSTVNDMRLATYGLLEGDNFDTDTYRRTSEQIALLREGSMQYFINATITVASTMTPEERRAFAKALRATHTRSHPISKETAETIKERIKNN
jgi:uncharacterized membrane protein